jgi:hypothetical protein
MNEYLDYNDFQGLVKTLTGDAYIYSNDSWCSDPYIAQTWCSGGQSGGSCWDEGKPNYYARESDDPPAEWQVLENLIDGLFPNLSYRDYKTVIRPLIRPFSYSENEYYGNYTNYSGYLVSLKDLHKLYLKGTLR